MIAKDMPCAVRGRVVHDLGLFSLYATAPAVKNIQRSKQTKDADVDRNSIRFQALSNVVN